MSRPRPLTDRQRQVLAFVVAEIDRCGMPPTRREICAHLGMTTSGLNAVREHLLALSSKGFVTQDPMVARGIRVTALGRAEVPSIEAAVLLTARGFRALSAPTVASYRPINPAPRLKGSTT